MTTRQFLAALDARRPFLSEADLDKPLGLSLDCPEEYAVAWGKTMTFVDNVELARVSGELMLLLEWR